MKPETKTFAFKLDGPPDDEGRFSGYAAVFGNVDKGNDVIERGAVTKTLQENPEVPIFWVHNYGKVPVGIGQMESDGKKGVRVEGQLFLETSELAREVFGAMKAGAVKGLSIGYNTLQRSFKGAVRHLREIAIGEVSLCPFPMNDGATVDGFKDWKYGWPVSDDVTDVSCLQMMITAGVDYLDNEASEGDAAGVAAMQEILSRLADLLAVEIAEVGERDADAEDTVSGVALVETMREPVHFAIKKLQTLLDREPVAATHDVDGAAEDNAEPAIATLRDLTSALTR
jgi:HK97 family phage prohead protease